MVELYHNFLSTCSQKVRLVLAEKGVDYKSHEIDLINGAQHDPEYVKLNPNHVVPTLVHDGAVLIESTLINEYLDDAFPQPALRPADPAERHAMRLFVKKIEDRVASAAGVITFGIGTRPMMLQRSPEEIQAAIDAIPDPKRRAVRKSVTEHGIQAPEMAAAVRAFVDLLDDMETALADRSWLIGDTFSLADCAALPYVLRLDHLAMNPLLAAELRPKVADWYARLQAKPAYEIAVESWLNEVVVKLFRSNGQAVWSDVEPLTR